MRHNCYELARRIRLIELVGIGISNRSKLYVASGINYSKISKTLAKLVELGYVQSYDLSGSSGVNPKGFALTDKGVEFYRILDKFDDVLGEKLNTYSVYG